MNIYSFIHITGHNEVPVQGVECRGIWNLGSNQKCFQAQVSVRMIYPYFY